MEQFLDEDGRFSLARGTTKTQEDLDRVIGLGKPQRVIDMFKEMVDLGNDWDYCWACIYWMNDVVDWERSSNVADEYPKGPVKLPPVVVDYSVQRAQEYPALAEFADAYVHAQNGNTGPMDLYVQACNDVKAKYPK